MAVKYTYNGTDVFICATTQAADLDQTGFEALTWIQINGVGNAGEWSTEDNILSYNTVDEDVSQKQKGIRNAGDPVIEVARDAADTGQDTLRIAANSALYYALKRTLPDGTNQYTRAIIGGPSRPGGANEDFILEQFNVGMVQLVLEDA